METKQVLKYFLSSVHAFDHGVILSVPVVAVFIAIQSGLEQSLPLMILLIGLSHIPYGFGALLAGYLCDKLGPLKTLQVGLTISTTSLLVIFAFPAWQLFFTMLFLVGLGNSFNHPTCLTQISHTFKENRGKAMGTFGFLGNIGQFSSPLMAGVVSAFIGWRYVYLIWAVLGMVLLLTCIRVARRVEPVCHSASDEKEEQGAEYRRAAAGLLSFAVLAVLFVALFRGFFFDGTTTFLPFHVGVYMKDSVSGLVGAIIPMVNDDAILGALGGSIFIFILLVAGSPGHLLGGHMADRYGPKKPLIIFTAISLVSICLMLLPHIALFLAGLVLFGFAYFGGQPSENVLIAEVSASRVRGLLFGLKFVVAFGLGSLGPILVAGVLSVSGATAAIVLLAVFAGLSLAAVTMVKRGAK